MRASLQERCETQIRNETALRKGHLLEFEAVMKLGAMMYVNAGREVDVDRLKECKRILKGKVGLLSNFRGHMQYLVQIKMALSDDPNEYINGVLDVYQRLKQGLVLPGEMVAMAATTIYENCPAEERDAVADKTREAYAKIKRQHRFLTGEEDLALVALMVMAGIDPDRAAERAEELYVMLKDRYLPGSDTPQSVAMVLALSEKPVEQKVQDFFDLYEACKAAGHSTGKGKAMTIYATYADMDANRDKIVDEIGEVDLWLKKKRGYGALGVGASVRRLLAATFVLEDLQGASTAATAGVTSAVAQAVVEEMLIILISIIVTSAIVSANANSHH